MTIFKLAFALGATSFLIGCGNPKGETSSSGKDAATPSGTSVKAAEGDNKSNASGVKVGMVTDIGGIDDQSFNAGSWSGLLKAEKELSIAKPKYVASHEQNDYTVNLASLAEKGNDLVIGVGFMMEDAIADAAKSHPNTKFAIIDGKVPDGLKNALSLKFKEEEGSFLAGYLAAKVSKKGSIGFIGGVESPLITKFEVGYIAGARTANPAVKVIAKYVGNWTDNAKGQQMASELFHGGTDIIFAAAGKGGIGVIDAAAAMGDGYFAIGVDSDQDGIKKGRVLTSMMKGVDTAVYDTVKAVKEGKFVSGTRIFGVKEGGVHLSPMTYTKDKVPADVLKQIDTLSKMISDGKIVAPSTRDGLNSFIVPKL